MRSPQEKIQTGQVILLTEMNFMDKQQHSKITCMNPKKATSNEQTPNKKKKPTAFNLQVRINPRETACKEKWTGLEALTQAALLATCLLGDTVRNIDRNDKAKEITSNNYFDLAVIKIEDETEIFIPNLNSADASVET